MRQEKPIKIIKHNDDGHKRETRVFARNIHESFCMQSGCKFKGRHAQQGVCHTTDSYLGYRSGNFDHIERAEKYAADALAELKNSSPKSEDYLRHLEASYICDWMNHQFSLDELIFLRRKVALMELTFEEKFGKAGLAELRQSVKMQ